MPGSKVGHRIAIPSILKACFSRRPSFHTSAPTENICPGNIGTPPMTNKGVFASDPHLPWYRSTVTCAKKMPKLAEISLPPIPPGESLSNRLTEETSPYLLQHAHNPVDWFAWGAEAFSTARRRDVPILLSIGYSACHWCHVMERESFED